MKLQLYLLLCTGVKPDLLHYGKNTDDSIWS